ncbi:SurA N-terminal domain-containing protein [Desulfurella sp.]|uniref:SurA N-terminal domain-containing protein n=1 Tax=Desulfurella sp. TaxID=1962857 RepID=UPI003D146870
MKFLASLFLVMVLFSATAFAQTQDKVLATVNGYEITQSAVDNIMKSLPAGVVNDKNSAQIRENVLNSLISERVLLDEAKKLNLEKDPQVVQEIKAQTDNILINALLQKKFGNQSFAPSEKEITDFYNQNKSKLKDSKGQVQPLSKIKPEIAQYLTNLKKKQALDNYIEELKKQDKVIINK